MTADKPTPIISMRHAFLQYAPSGAIDGNKIVLAEQANPLSHNAGYGNLLSFESDIAQIVSLILLFSESPGSLAELGAFAALETVSEKLMVVIDDFYYESQSFIKDGPVAFLEQTHGDESVLVIDRQQIGVGTDYKVENICLSAFWDAILPPIKQRLNHRRPVNRDPKSSGYIILVITGLIQYCGALTMTEIREMLSALQISAGQMEIQKYLYCARIVGWIRKVKKGNHTFYIAFDTDLAIDFIFKQEAGLKDKLRWRACLREQWREKDSARFRGIAETLHSNAAANE